MAKTRRVEASIFACVAAFVLLSAVAARVREQTFFHLKTGRLETRWRLGKFRLWSKTGECFSEEFFRTISPRMPGECLKISDRPLFVKIYGGDASRCPAELRRLFYLSLLENYTAEEKAERAHEIVSKYRRHFVNGLDE